MKFSFSRMEWAGSVGDLGALLPLALAMIMINGLSATGVFMTVAGLYIIGGFYYRLPIAVQPMKVIAAYAIAQAVPSQVITASAMWVAVILLTLGSTGLVDRVAKILPRVVIRGVQMTTGIMLLSKGARLVAGTSSFQAMYHGVEPYLSISTIGPVPMSLLLGIIFGIVSLLLLNHRRFPAGLVTVLLGAAVGTVLGAWRGLGDMQPGLYLPSVLPFGLPSWADLSFALFAMVLPQIPMTVGNAVIANRDLSFEYFGTESRRVTDRALCVSMGLANVFAALVGGMPVCHGAGGLAAHYRFGARTNGSNIIIGGIFLGLALFFGPTSVNLLHLIPMGVLGVLLFFSGTQLALTVLDVESRNDMFIILAMVGITMVSNLTWAGLTGIFLYHAMRRTNARI